MLTLALVLLAAASPVAGASCADPIKGDHLTMIRRPTSMEFDRAYPARTEMGDGEARLLCSFGPQGRLARCIVEREEPPGRGLGEAALKLAPRFQYATTTRDGSPVAGRCTRLVIKWRIG